MRAPRRCHRALARSHPGVRRPRWLDTGFRSCAAWLSWRVGFAPGAAREHVRVARALGTLPRLAQALARGELSYSKVRELTRVATPETEERLLAVGRAGTAEHVERIIRGWRRMDYKSEFREANRQHAGRALHVYQDEDGTVTVRGRLTPEVGALLVKALAAAREALHRQSRVHVAAVAPETPTMAQQQADALALLAESALHHGIDPGAPGERYQVVVHVDAEVLADVEAPGQSVPRGWRTRSSWNVPALGVRREPGGHAPRCGRAGGGGRGSHAYHTAGTSEGTPPSGRRLSLSGVWTSLRPGSSHPPLGARRPHDAVKPRGAVSPAPPCGPRGGVPGRAPSGWRAGISATERLRVAGRAAVAGSGARSHCGHPSAPRGGRASSGRAHRDAALAGERLDVGYAIDVLHPLAVRESQS